MDNVKSFYDFDYIIEMSEKRVEQYTSAYQLILGRLTNIILIYSALGIYLVPIIQDISQIPSVFFRIGVGLFIVMIIVSVVFTIRLLMPVDIAYFQMSSVYYQDLRLEYEEKIVKPGMTEEQREMAMGKVNNLLKASYIDELIRAQSNNRSILRRKGSFYYNALLFGLVAIVPYVLCVGFHITRKIDSIQKVEIINPQKIVTCNN
ncbi:MAG TPA: hypothetical protein VNS58_27690 [Puia sp.]|nr:hypothetical protein [Puia sp.]